MIAVDGEDGQTDIQVLANEIGFYSFDPDIDGLLAKHFFLKDG